MALVTTLTMDNLWHAVFHAIPLGELSARLDGAAVQASSQPRRAVLWPRFTVRPPAASQSVADWTGWELVVRCVLAAAPTLFAGESWRTVAAATQRRRREGQVHCFRTAVGGHTDFYPRVGVSHPNKLAGASNRWRTEQLRAAAPRLKALRDRVLLSMRSSTRPVTNAEQAARSAVAAAWTGRLLGRPRARLLWVLRRHSRVVTNVDALQAAVARHTTLVHAVAFVDMGASPLHTQLRLATAASGLAGVHGQALFHALFLSPSPQAGRTALLELVPAPSMASSGTHSQLDYWRVAVSANVSYYRQLVADAAECAGQYFRTCGNVTVQVAPLLDALSRLLSHLDGSSSVPCDEPPTAVKGRQEIVGRQSRSKPSNQNIEF